LVLALIRGKGVAEARRILQFSPKRAAKSILKTLESAAANAKQKGVKEEKLRVSRAVADPGPSFKRVRPVSRGQAHRILKRTTHVTIELEAEGHPKPRRRVKGGSGNGT
jgi:large subunit ribosomal protein L22